MSSPVDVSEDRLVEYVLGEMRRDEAQALEGLIQTDAPLATEVRRLRQVFELMPYATLEEPPVDLRARILDAAVARAQPVAKNAPRPAARAARRVVWSRFIAAAAAMVALAFGFDSWRTRQELALQREVTVALQEPNVVRSFALAGTGARERRGRPGDARPRRQEGRGRAEGHAGAACRRGLSPVGGGRRQERAVRPVHRRSPTAPSWRSSWSRSNRTPRPSASSSSPSSRRRSQTRRRVRG